MRRLAICAAAIAAFAGPTLGASLPNPIALAAAGQLQCYSPDMARKTCDSLAGYAPGANGAIDNDASVLVSQMPAIVMRTVSPVEIKNGEVCGKIRKQDLDAAAFTVDGREVSAADAATLRAQMLQAYRTMLEHEICTAYVPAGAGFIAKAKMDGTPMPPATEQRVIWVSPKDGWRVAP